MRLYEVVFDEKEDKGVYALSCVDAPAMEDQWITLKDHHKHIQFEAVDEEKRLLLGAALIPNKKVYRKMGEEEFYITFPEKTIEACAHAFLKNGYQNNSSVNHEVKLEGVSVVESWIVEDPETDKSKRYGKTYEKGTWVTMMKVDNDQAWQDAKAGKLNGFSIDGLFSLKELNFKKDEQMSKFDALLTKLETFLNKKEEVKMGQLKLKDGKTVVEFEGDAPEVGMPVFILSEDKEEKFRAPEGSHELENGEVLHVDANGLVAEEIKEEEVDEELVAALAAMLKKQSQELTEAFEAKLKEVKDGFDSQLAAEKQKNEELEAKLKEEPAAPKIVKAELNIEPKTAGDRLWMAIQKNKN